MGLLDILFGKKAEKERLIKEYEAEQERLRLAQEKRIADEREARLATNKKKEEERLARLKSQQEADNSTTESVRTSFKIDGREIVVDAADLKIDQEALNAYEAHDYPTAIAKYSFLIEKNRSAFQYYKFRGTVYEDMGDDNSAFNDFAKAVDLCPTDAVALYRLAMVYHRRKDLRTAIKYLEEAYKYSPTYDNLMGNSYNNILFVHKRVIACNLANFLTQSNRVEEGLKLLDEVISNSPDYSFPYFVKAITLANKGDYKRAASSAEKASVLGHPQANALLGQIRAKMTVSNSNDRFSEMVDKASFNPFNITTDKALQNTTPLPDYRNVFARELTNLFSTLNGHMSEDAVVTSYIFNLAESYYNNAGYIPKNSLDDIIESVYSAYQNTSYYNPSITLNDVKYKVYFSLLNR